MLINYESCIGAFLLTTLLPYYYSLHIILFMHLLSTNHKCIQPYYFPLLYKPAAQKVKMVMKNFLMRSSRLCAARLLFLRCYVVFRYSVSQESRFSI
jgi:hypothetical protein